MADASQFFYNNMALRRFNSALACAVSFLLLFAPNDVNGNAITSWWVKTDEVYAPQIFKYNETTGKIYASLCNSQDAPVFAQNDSTALQTTIAPISNTSIASFGYLSGSTLEVKQKSLKHRIRAKKADEILRPTSFTSPTYLGQAQPLPQHPTHATLPADSGSRPPNPRTFPMAPTATLPRPPSTRQAASQRSTSAPTPVCASFSKRQSTRRTTYNTPTHLPRAMTTVPGGHTWASHPTSPQATKLPVDSCPPSRQCGRLRRQYL